MTATFTGNEVDDYVAEVAAHLGALPDGERAELLDDLREHLAEVAAEGDGPLGARLGSPADYAAELLASAGLAPTQLRSSPVEHLRSWWRSMQGQRLWREATTFLSELRPAWWVLRALLAVYAITVYLVNDYERTWPVPDPGPFNRGLLWVPAIAAVVVSVAVGRRMVGRRSTTVVLGNVFVVVATVLAITAMHSRSAGVQVVVEPQARFLGSDGRPITNIFPYDASGQLLRGILLYDQAGHPIDVRGQAIDQGIQSGGPFDANGAPIGNAYPLEQRLSPGEEVGPEPGPPPAVVVPRPATTTGPVSGAG